MLLYGRLFALLYDPFVALAERKGMRDIRRTVLSDAKGRTLELGAGTGLNLALYPTAVTSLTLTDPETPMVRQLRRAARRDDRPVEIVQAPGEHLPFADGEFDTVVCTIVLCTVSNVVMTLQEISRVLAPDGQLLLIEHVRAREARLMRWQDRLHRPWHAFGYGCHCNLDTALALTQSGFEIAELREERWRGMPPIVQPLITGRLPRTHARCRVGLIARSSPRSDPDP
ncbi:MAG: class I SAM-dependent methyltransferase [Actinomycetota bacterium]